VRELVLQQASFFTLADNVITPGCPTRAAVNVWDKGAEGTGNAYDGDDARRPWSGPCCSSSRALALLSCAESVARRACATGDSFGGQSGVHRALLARACSGDAAGSLPCVRCLQPLPKGLSPRRTEQGSVTAFPSPLVHSCSRGVRCSWRAPRLCAACGLRRRAVLRGLFEHPGLPGARPAALRTRSMPGGTSACRPKPAHALRITITCAEGVQRLREQQRAARAGRVARVRALKRCAQAMVGRYLSVECSGYKPDGTPLRFKASGWQARILQHEVRGPRPPLIAANVLGPAEEAQAPLKARAAHPGKAGAEAGAAPEAGPLHVSARSMFGVLCSWWVFMNRWRSSKSRCYSSAATPAR